MLVRFFQNNNDGISPARIKAIKARHGKDVLIGLDPGVGLEPDGEFLASAKELRKHAMSLHVYLVGPGMWEWSGEERRQIRDLAKSIGIDTSEGMKKSPTPKWFKRDWLGGGWKKKTFELIKTYASEHGAYSFEIDNLDGVIGQVPAETVSLYREIATHLKAQGLATKLVMKNLSSKQLKAVIEAVGTGALKKDLLCEWGMFEEGTGDPDEQIALCKELGVRAVTPKSGITPTDRYGTVERGVGSL